MQSYIYTCIHINVYPCTYSEARVMTDKLQPKVCGREGTFVKLGFEPGTYTHACIYLSAHTLINVVLRDEQSSFNRYKILNNSSSFPHSPCLLFSFPAYTSLPTLNCTCAMHTCMYSVYSPPPPPHTHLSLARSLVRIQNGKRTTIS